MTDRALEVYEETLPATGVETHFAVGTIHRPMKLLLRICESSEHYAKEEMTADIEMALAFDVDDSKFSCILYLPRVKSFICSVIHI